MRISFYIFALGVLIINGLTSQPLGRNPQETAIIEHPQVISAVAPVFPDRFGDYKEYEIIVVKLDIDKTGKVLSAIAVSGNPALRPYAERAARGWLFSPAIGNVENRSRAITFSFRTMPDRTSPEELTPVFFPPDTFEVRHIHGVNTQSGCKK
jgi:hypothetical protein